MGRTKGTTPGFSRHPGRQLIGLPKLPDDFLYFGSGAFLGHFDVLIKQYGIRIHQTHGVSCPCISVSRYGGESIPQPSCTSCFGRGIAYVDEDTEEHTALVTGISAEDRRAQEGSMASGMIQITVQSQIIFDDGDRVTLPDSLMPIKAMRRYSAETGGIILPFLVSGVEVLVTKGPRPDDPLISLTDGLDFVLDPVRRLLAFPEGSRVTDGMTVSGTFLGMPDYVISDSPHNARGRLAGVSPTAAHIQFPRRYMATRADILFGQDRKETVYPGDASP